MKLTAVEWKISLLSIFYLNDVIKMQMELGFLKIYHLSSLYLNVNPFAFLIKRDRNILCIKIFINFLKDKEVFKMCLICFIMIYYAFINLYDKYDCHKSFMLKG